MHRVKDAVAAETDDVKSGAPVALAPLAVTEDVLRHHRETLEKLRERPQHLDARIGLRQEQGRNDAGHDDDRKTARVVPPLVSSVEPQEEAEHDDGRGDVGKLEEDEVESLLAVQQIQIPRHEDEEVQDLGAPRDSTDGPVVCDGGKQQDDAEQVQVVPHVTENVPRVTAEARNVIDTVDKHRTVEAGVADHRPQERRNGMHRRLSSLGRGLGGTPCLRIPAVAGPALLQTGA
mmetsp:Transcript_93355/g.263513  ORF Transcript_93355/g.263513 Transcript_93355/m.263513 type:complete len:233 (+) Transcript_93355:349-1047(+)